MVLHERGSRFGGNEQQLAAAEGSGRTRGILSGLRFCRW